MTESHLGSATEKRLPLCASTALSRARPSHKSWARTTLATCWESRALVSPPNTAAWQLPARPPLRGPQPCEDGLDLARMLLWQEGSECLPKKGAQYEHPQKRTRRR
eukprot:6466939-Amphidinium_carterae.1